MAFRFLLPVEAMHDLQPDKDADQIKAARQKFLDVVQKSYKEKTQTWQVWEERITAKADGGEPCKVYVHRPPDCCDEVLPLVLWMHGGAYTVLSGQDSIGAGQITRLRDRGVPVVWASVDYALSPENPFPAGFDDCWHCLQAFLHDKELAKKYGYDPQNVHIAGVSAGAGLAAGLVYELQRRGGEDLAVVRSAWVQEPMLEPLTNTDAYIENGDARIAPVKWLRWCWEGYCSGVGGVEAAREDPRICPHLHVPALSPGDASFPVLVTTALGDALRDDGRAYAKTLRDAGVEVNHIETRGTHATGMLFDKEKGEAIFAAWEELLRRPAQTPLYSGA